MSWIFNLRTQDFPDSDDSDNGDVTDQPTKTTEHAKFMKELDLSSRPDNATYKPDPWTIAKINAASRRIQGGSGNVISSISDTGPPAKCPMSPKGRGVSIYDALKKQAERPPPASGAPVLKPSNVLPSKPTPQNICSKPTSGSLLGRDLPHHHIPAPAAIVQEVITDEDRSLHHTDSMPISAHILTDSTKTNFQTPASRPTAFPNSFSSPLRPQMLVSPLSPRAGLLPETCSSPPRSFHPGAKERHSTARQVTITSRFPHVRRVHNRPFTPHASGSSISKASIDQFHQRRVPHMHEKSPSISSISSRSSPRLHESHFGFSADQEPEDRNEARSPLRGLPSEQHLGIGGNEELVNDYSMWSRASSQLPTVHHSFEGIDSGEQIHEAFASNTNRSDGFMTSEPALPRKVSTANSKSKRSPSQLSRLSPPMKRTNKRDPYASLALLDSDPDLEWSTLRKDKRTNAQTARLKSNIRTSGTFRLPLLLRKAKEGSHSSPQPKRRVVTYLPPPMITAHSQKPSAMENASQSREFVTPSVEPTPKAEISRVTTPNHHTSKGDSAQGVSPDHDNIRMDTSSMASYRPQRETVDEIIRIDMVDLEKNYPRMKKTMCE